MANHHPIRAIGAAQRRAIESRLSDHAKWMAQFQAEGFSRDEASRRAFLMVKFGTKPNQTKGER